MQEGRRARRSLQSSLQLRLPDSELVKFLLKPRGAKTLSDGVDQPVQFPADCVELPALGAFVCRDLTLEPVPFSVELGNERGDMLRFHQTGLKSIQDHLVQLVALNTAPVAARALPSGGRAGQVVAPDVGHRPVTAAAEELTAEHVLCPAVLPIARAVWIIGA